MRALSLLLAAGLLAGCGAPSAAPRADSAPAISLGALGDSLMAGYNADASHSGVHAEVSWPTGVGIGSFAERLGAQSAKNLARPQEKLSALPRQAALMGNASFVLVGFGANDLCSGGGTNETTVVPVSPEEFEAQLRTHVRSLVSTGAQVLVVSIPDLVAMHAVAPMPSPANSFVYFFFGAGCGRTSDQFRSDIQAYNAAILRVTQSERALDDAGAVWKLKWSREMVSEVDGVHPSVAGAKAMASAVWNAYAARVPAAGASGR